MFYSVLLVWPVTKYWICNNAIVYWNNKFFYFFAFFFFFSFIWHLSFSFSNFTNFPLASNKLLRAELKTIVKPYKHSVWLWIRLRNSFFFQSFPFLLNFSLYFFVFPISSVLNTIAIFLKCTWDAAIEEDACEVRERKKRGGKQDERKFNGVI